MPVVHGGDLICDGPAQALQSRGCRLQQRSARLRRQADAGAFVLEATEFVCFGVKRKVSLHVIAAASMVDPVSSTYTACGAAELGG